MPHLNSRLHDGLRIAGPRGRVNGTEMSGRAFPRGRKLRVMVPTLYDAHDRNAVVSGLGRAREICDGQFVLARDRVFAFLEVGSVKKATRFVSPRALEWVPVAEYRVADDGYPFLPKALRDGSERADAGTLLFVRRPGDEHYTYVGVAFVGSYGVSFGVARATFEVYPPLDRERWKALGTDPSWWIPSPAPAAWVGETEPLSAGAIASLDALNALVPPPNEPRAPRGSWSSLERALETTLPRDFKALTERYGAGSFDGEIVPYHPFFAEYPMLGNVARVLDVERTMRAEFPANARFPLHPEPGGFLPWGSGANGELLGWLTEGADPERWPTVLYWPRDGKHRRFELGAVEFLYRWLEGTLDGLDARCGPAPSFRALG